MTTEQLENSITYSSNTAGMWIDRYKDEKGGKVLVTMNNKLHGLSASSRTKFVVTYQKALKLISTYTLRTYIKLNSNSVLTISVTNGNNGGVGELSTTFKLDFNPKTVARFEKEKEKE